MKNAGLITSLLCLGGLCAPAGWCGESEMYHDGWIDLNKNGTMDPYENPAVDIVARIDDLIAQMNLDEKTCQLVTLYGYNRVLKDPLPTEEWKTEIWKDGLANIDGH
ncbi:MAG: beta-glucosidase, partial [Nitrospinae bacterium]|nr:beta-glucosidase [Nitrospinota bacterium]